MLTTDDDELAARVDELRLMRRGHGALVRRPGGRLQGEPLGRPRGDRPLSARQGRAPRGDPPVATSPPTTRRSAGCRGSSRWPADPRDVHALHLYVVRDRPRARRSRPGRRTSTRSPRRTSARASTSCRCTGSPTTASATPTSSRCPSPSARGARCSRCRFSPAHTDGDIADAIDALRRVHAAFTR